MVTYGVDHVKKYRSWLTDGRVGLITSSTGRDSRFRATITVLREVCELTALFAPEHGIRGERGAGELAEDYRDELTGLPVYSLYGRGGKGFQPEWMDCFDILVYDIQDIGVRYYTFLSTLLKALEACSPFAPCSPISPSREDAYGGKRLVVLDRPNPLGGEIVEGGRLDPLFASFVGCHPLPVRYGLTSGEAAGLMNRELALGCEVKVIPCKGWRRGQMFPQYGRIWPMPSQSLATFEATLLYPGSCLIEGTNCSEGRGTAAPFRIIGAPYVDGEQLTEAFNRERLTGVWATPIWFCPTASKHQGELCGGLLLHVTDSTALQPVAVGLLLLDLLRELYPDDFQILPPSRIGGRPFLTLLGGDGTLAGDWDRKQLLERFQEESQRFAFYKEQYHLYD